MFIDDLIGKVVKLYPHDTYEKHGRILNIKGNGFLFEIVQADTKSGYSEGDIVYFSNPDFIVSDHD
jgi:hypothetical protein